MLTLLRKGLIHYFLRFSMMLILSLVAQKIYASTGTLRAIGDIQGDIQALNEILLKSGSVNEKGELQPNLTLIFVGDLVGSGPNSPAVIQTVMDLHSQSSKVNSQIIFVAGNHEINLLNNRYHAISKEDQKNWTEWLDPNSHWKESIYNSLHQPLSTNLHSSILRQYYSLLVPWYKTDNLLFVHAGVSKKMLNGIPTTLVAEFKARILNVLEGGSSINPMDWLFSMEGPTLTANTADPEHAEFLLEPPISSVQLEEFLAAEQLKKIIVGHWSTKGTISFHSLFADRILHIDTGISLETGALSYLDIKPNGDFTAYVWKKGHAKIQQLMPGIKGCIATLNSI